VALRRGVNAQKTNAAHAVIANVAGDVSHRSLAEVRHKDPICGPWQLLRIQVPYRSLHFLAWEMRVEIEARIPMHRLSKRLQRANSSRVETRISAQSGCFAAGTHSSVKPYIDETEPLLSASSTVSAIR